MIDTDPGSTLRVVREAAGLSLGALAKRIYFSKCNLSNLERGRRRVTPQIVEAYLRTFGEDMHRRQMLMALLGGAACPDSALERAFEWSLDRPDERSVDEWLDHARTVLDGLTPEQQGSAVILLMQEIEATAGGDCGTALNVMNRGLADCRLS